MLSLDVVVVLFNDVCSLVSVSLSLCFGDAVFCILFRRIKSSDTGCVG